MILPRLGRDAEIRTEESRIQLGHQLLAGVSMITKAFASEFPVKAALVLP